jgi:hypothetical protein
VRKERGKTPSFFGRTSKVKTFFRDRDGEDPDTVAYTEHVPVLFPEPKKEKYDSVAIQKFTDRRRGIIFDRYPTLQTTHIKIQSPILCRELQPLLKPYDVDFEDGYAEIFAPFKPLFFARHEIYRRSRQFDEGTEEREHLDLLLNDVLNEDMWQLIKEVDDLENENKITWPLLWALFPNESVVIVREHEGHEQAYQILHTDYADDNGTPLFFDIRCQYVHFNGLQFGLLEKDQTIPYFTGKKCITDLDVYPLRLAKQSSYLQQKLISRGKKVLDYQDVHHVEINPATIDTTRPNYYEVMKDLGRGEVGFCIAKCDSCFRLIMNRFTDAQS